MKTFRCYSVPFKDFLLENGLRYEFIAIDPSTNKKFWLFIRDGKFNNLRKEWNILQSSLN